MANGYIESIDKVNGFLRRVTQILCSDDFNIDNDLDVLLSTINETTGYKNFNTLNDLNYEKSDIRNILLTLTIADYSETLPDISDVTLPPLYVFGKMINSNDVYIKVKIRDRNKQQVFCISFHYAQFQISKPYR